MSFFKIIKSDLICYLACGGLSEVKLSFYKVVVALIAPEFKLVFYYRLYSNLYRLGYRRVSYVLYCRAKRLFSSDIHPGCKIGPGLRLGHHMNIVIGPDAVIGCNAYIFNGITLGKKYPGTADKMPVVGDNVLIGTGAKLLGAIKIGNDAVIGANSLVINSFPDGCCLVGSPAVNKKMGAVYACKMQDY